MKNRFRALEALRVFAFFNVFWFHTQWYNFFEFHQSAAWAVSFFITLSGFLYGYRYFNQETFNWRFYKEFCKKRFFKFWPLHIVTLLCIVPFSQIFIFNEWGENLKNWIIKFLFNLSLTHTWINNSDIYYSFNGVSWFLSVMVFLTLVTIPILVLLKKLIKSKHDVYKYMAIVIFATFIWYSYGKKTEISPSYWFYIFPPARLFEYIAGMLLGILLTMKSRETIPKLSNVKKFIWTFVEVAILVGIIISFPYVEKVEYLWQSVGWILPNIVLILIFAEEKGVFTKILSCKFIVYLGSLTFNAYLIHQVVNMYFSVAIGATDSLDFLTKFKSEIFILVITFVLSTKKNATYFKLKENN